MSARSLYRILCLLAFAFAPLAAEASGGCALGSTVQAASSYAQRIATTACREHTLWFSPFIDADGRLASMTVAEAETAHLTDGATPAWKRVADYWRSSGLLWQMQGFPGASDCGYAGSTDHASSSCRAFLIDRPWSAAFVSYVLLQAGLPGFQPSPSHVDYVRASSLASATSPFQFDDPDRAPAAVGDLLCYVRSAVTQFGHLGLRDFLERNPGAALNMHCDIVVAADRGAGKLYLVGGNVLQGVTMRIIAINRAGLPWNLPRGAGRSTACWPANPAGCNFNRQDWAALLRLKPDAALALLPRPVSALPPAQGMDRARQQCCVHCVVGSGVPRCRNP